MNTDGAPVFKSSNDSIWPIYLAINELPYKMRMKMENLILAGLLFGSQKSTMSTFLKPLLKSFTELEGGIELTSPDLGTFQCKGYLLCCTADLPAKCMLCNSIQFNGSYSCWRCIQKGITASVGKGHTHVFPFNTESPKRPVRTPTNVRKDAIKAIDNQRMKKKDFIENGVKGFSWLNFFPMFDIVNGVAIDYLHGVLLGVQRLLIRLWFSKEHVGKPFSFHNSVCEVDKRLLALKPSTSITRLPRTIAGHLKYWKASEFRSFLLYYGVPVLNGILDQSSFFHYILFVNAVYIFLTCSSSEDDIVRAENTMLQFCSTFDKLYDVPYMTLNVHQLVHLADNVRYLGPLYTHSCFPFEDKNGSILKMIKGTQNIDIQIITGISFIQKLPELKQKCISKGSETEKLCFSIENPNAIKRRKMLKSGVYVLGANSQRELADKEYAALISYCGNVFTTDSFSCFNRLEFHNSLVYGLEYLRMEKRNSSIIMYKERNQKNFCSVRYFLEISEGRYKNTVVAVTEEIKCLGNADSSHILPVKKTDIVKVVPVNSIVCQCLLIDVPDRSFICLFPNKLECD